MSETNVISVAISMYDDGYNRGRANAIDELRDDLMKEIAELNEVGLTNDNLKTFAYRIKMIAEQLKEKQND